MNILKIILRIWFTIASVAGFVGGWVLLAHAPKPKPLVVNTTAAVITDTSVSQLPPIPSLDSLTGSGVQGNQQFFQSLQQSQTFNSAPFQTQSSQSVARPRLRTSVS